MAYVEDVVAQLAGRADMYRALGNLYLNALDEGQIEELALTDYDALRADPDERIASGFNDIYRALRRRNTGTRQLLAMDFTSCFLGTKTYKGLTGAPYESLYRDSSGTLMGPVRTQVFNEYKRERVALQPELNLPDDHLSFEMEFLAILCERCAQSVEAGNRDEALRLLDVQKSFLEEHLLAWFPRFHNLTTKLLETRFYRGVLNVTRGFLESEPESIEALASAVAKDLEVRGDADGAPEGTSAGDAYTAACGADSKSGAEGGESAGGDAEAQACAGQERRCAAAGAGGSCGKQADGNAADGKGASADSPVAPGRDARPGATDAKESGMLGEGAAAFTASFGRDAVRDEIEQQGACEVGAR